MPPFRLVSEFKPCGDQPQAIESLVRGLREGKRAQTLLGVTGSGKTYTMANVIEAVQRPTLVISHNKTLAAQLYAEFRSFFPENAVRYFVSYYDYYQPEAYIPERDIYIEKDVDINEDIDRLRLAATSALISRRDVIIVATVSCIYGLGSPEDYSGLVLHVKRGNLADRDGILRRLVDIQYVRAEADFVRGSFRARGNFIDIFPSYEETALRIDVTGDKVVSIETIDPLTMDILASHDEATVFPAKHFVIPQERIDRALQSIEAELAECLAEFKRNGKLLEAQRLEARTRYDLELLREVGYCKGIENYSRHLSGRLPGQRPYCLIDYFPRDFLTFVDESHVTIPQLRGMYHGDRTRKDTLVRYGFRLPSARDNRPMRFDEWEASVSDVIFFSATPGPYELQKAGANIVEQLIRPTGLVDPEITVRPATHQVRDLLKEIKKRVARRERVLVTTLTKRLAEELSSFLQAEGIKGAYLHSEIETIERVQLLRSLREGKFDVIVGVNLLREGLDLPEVSLVAILDADKEGFLRSETSIIQTVGRAARNVNGQVILYADVVTGSMQRAMAEMARRRQIQLKYNEEHNITPRTIEKEIRRGIEDEISARRFAADAAGMSVNELEQADLVSTLEKEMFEAAEALEFERAAELRDRIAALKEKAAKQSRRSRVSAQLSAVGYQLRTCPNVPAGSRGKQLSQKPSPLPLSRRERRTKSNFDMQIGTKH